MSGGSAGSIQDLRLSHYTTEALKFDPNREFLQSPPNDFGKPRGFWVSVDGEMDWLEWCLSEDAHCIGLLHRNRVQLRSEGYPEIGLRPVKLIRTLEEFDEFEKTYLVEIKRSWHSEWKSYGIDWEHVSSDYSGIIIAPYFWERRMSTPMCEVSSWYYTWDCASGCIWDSRAIESVTPVEDWQRPKTWEQLGIDRWEATEEQVIQMSDAIMSARNGWKPLEIGLQHQEVTIDG